MNKFQSPTWPYCPGGIFTHLQHLAKNISWGHWSKVRYIWWLDVDIVGAGIYCHLLQPTNHPRWSLYWGQGTLYGSIVIFILEFWLKGFHELGSSWLELAEELSRKCVLYCIRLASTDQGSSAQCNVWHLLYLYLYYITFPLYVN